MPVLIKGYVIGIVALISLPAIAYQGQMAAGVTGGYSVLDRGGALTPDTANGASFGLDLSYGLTESFGIGLETNFDVQSPFTLYGLGEVPGEAPGETEIGPVEINRVKASYVSQLTLSIIYVLDVMKLMPYFSLGVSGARNDQQTRRYDSWGYVLGMRLSIGAQYQVLEYLDVGAVFQSDFYYKGVSDFVGRIAVLARIAVKFNVGKLGKRPPPK
ncbi:MAG: hypothetical protein QNJ97_11980 [Myxococcota bacterium]|nr:hypothetical protein [Myxococcota bacterium]